MAQIVLVHGIAQEQKTADRLEQDWLPDLAGAVRLAGFLELADRLLGDRHAPGHIDTRMAFYGDLFLRPAAQGQGNAELTGETKDLADGIARAWLTSAALSPSGSHDQSIAERELAAITGEAVNSQVQGAGRAGIRRVVAALAKLSWFANAGQNLATHLVNQAVGQVALYMTDPIIRQAAIARVTALVGPDTRAVIGHSLGSVVAYDAIRSAGFPSRSLPLFVTLGSPLGFPNIIYHRLQPQPPNYPERIRYWINIAAEDDLVAAVQDLTDLFSEGKPEDAGFDGHYRVDNGTAPHSAAHYLSKEKTGAVVARALATS